MHVVCLCVSFSEHVHRGVAQPVHGWLMGVSTYVAPVLSIIFPLSITSIILKITNPWRKGNTIIARIHNSSFNKNDHNSISFTHTHTHTHTHTNTNTHTFNPHTTHIVQR